MMGAYFPCAVAITSFFFTLAGVPPFALLHISPSSISIHLSIASSQSPPERPLHPKTHVSGRQPPQSPPPFLYHLLPQPAVGFTGLLLILEIFFVIGFDCFQIQMRCAQQSACSCQRMRDTVVGRNERRSFVGKKLRKTLSVLPASRYECWSGL